jgi:DNA-binding transcriptional MocR family regulator
MCSMNSIEYLFVQYVICTVNERDTELVMNLTYENAMGIITQAGVNVIESPFDDDDDYD